MKACEVCTRGDASVALDAYEQAHPEVPPNVIRQARLAIRAPSSRGTLRRINALRRLGAPEDLVANILRKAEPIQLTACCGRAFHIGCEPPGIGECITCGAWLCPGEHSAGGCPKCGSGRSS